MKYLYDSLKKYSESDIYPMHMPGHKRNLQLMQMNNPYAIDITEIDGFDNLHDAREIIQSNMREAASLYQAKYTHYLINGSTSGLLTAIAACTHKGDKILVSRNCHKAVYNAICLNELQPVYIYPKINPHFGICQGVTVEQVEQKLRENPDCSAIVITSPTYEGIISDIKGIADSAHKMGIPLIVDEAHGAHLGFHEGFPNNSVAAGADIVIHSVHKTLPAFTQTALIHINDRFVDYNNVKRYLSIYQTSSPSYILMAGISNCMRLIKERGDMLFTQYYSRLKLFYDSVKHLKNLTVFSPHLVKYKDFFEKSYFGFDPSKLIIFTIDSTINGLDLYNVLLKKYKIQCEMYTSDYVIAMTSIADTDEGFGRLREALIEIDSMCGKKVREIDKKQIYKSNREQRIVINPSEAYNQCKEEIDISLCDGRIAGDYIYLYPPGIPLIAPGELITKDFIEDILQYQWSGLEVKGIILKDKNYLTVLGEENNG